MSTQGWVILSLMLLATLLLLLFISVSVLSKRKNIHKGSQITPSKRFHWINIVSDLKNYRKQEFWINQSDTYRQLNQKVLELSDSELEKESK